MANGVPWPAPTHDPRTSGSSTSTFADEPALARLSAAERLWVGLAERLGDVVWVAQHLQPQGALQLIYCSRRLEGWLAASSALPVEQAWSTLLAPSTMASNGSPTASSGDEERTLDVSEPASGTEQRWLRQRLVDLDLAAANEPGTDHAEKPTTSTPRTSRIGAVLEDVTERRRATVEQQTRLDEQSRARNEAERQAASKDEFISVVSHDLRSPLNAIRGWAHVLKLSNNLTVAQQRALDAIDRNITAQARMVDDLLDSQRILRGKLVLSFTRPTLATVIEEAVETIRSAADAKRITLDVRHDASIDTLEADADRLRQSIANLLSNSLKFTPEDGRIDVSSCMVAGVDDEPARVRITVSDTGIGLSSEQLAHVFDPVMKSDQPSGRRQGGLNLPLSLARQLIRMHGGVVSALSDGAEHGLTLVIELPREQPPRSAAVG